MPSMAKHSRKFGSLLGALIGDNPALLGVALIGFSVSFQTIARLAADHGLPGPPVLYPVLIDVGIMAMVIESRRAIDAGRSDLAPRILAWALIALTLYVNVHGSPPHDWLGRALHVAAPALWAALLELTRWRKLAKKRAESKREGIPLARWAAAPFSSLRMHRRMILRNTRSYAAAVELEDARRFIASITRAHFGRHWKREAPSVLLDRIRTGRLGDDVTAAAAASVRARATGGWEQAARDMVMKAVTEGDKLTASVRREKRQIEATAAASNGASNAASPKRQTSRRPAVKWRDKADRQYADNPAVTAPDLAQACKVSKRTAERYLADRKKVRELHPPGRMEQQEAAR